MRITYLSVLVVLLLVFGCLSDNNGQDNLYNYKGVTVARDEIPDKCWNKEDCAMFECMVSQCWCLPSELNEGAPTTGIVYMSNKKVQTEDEAKAVVKEYLEFLGTEYKGITKAVKLNAVFYNVFYEDASGSEYVLTVAIDGIVMKTGCGV